MDKLLLDSSDDTKKAFNNVRTGFMMTVCERSYARGDHVRWMRWMGLNVWDYQSDHSHVNPEQPMDVLIQALFDTKEAEGDQVYYVAFGRYKDVFADAVAWIYLYAYTKFRVHGSHTKRLPTGEVIMVPGHPFPNTTNKDFWDELVRQGHIKMLLSIFILCSIYFLNADSS